MEECSMESSETAVPKTRVCNNGEQPVTGGAAFQGFPARNDYRPDGFQGYNSNGFGGPPYQKRGGGPGYPRGGGNRGAGGKSFTFAGMAFFRR